MKYAVLGAGAMGSIIGAALAKSGQEVILIGHNRQHMDKIKNAGLNITLGQTTETIKMDACTDPNDAGEADVVILLVKTFNSRTAIEGAKRLFGKKTYICSLQNGLGNVDVLQEFFSRDKILHGVLRLAGRMKSPGEVAGEIGADVAVYLGSLTEEGEAVATAQLMAEHFTSGGLTTEYKTNIDNYIWDKAIVNICGNAICALTRLRVKEVFYHPEGRKAAEDTAKEAVAVAAAQGIELNYDAIMADIAAAVPIIGNHYPSMAQDMMNKKKTEIDSLNGTIVRYGQESGIPTPANEYITKFVKIIEENYKNQF